MVDWARASGFEVTAAGKGTKYLPIYHGSTPESVWQHYGFSREQVASGELNAQMFNSFIDGTKSAIEMTAVANATGLSAPSDGLLFPPCGVDDLAHVLRPKSHGGVLEGKGKVEVISSLERDGRPVFRDLRWGVYVVFEGATGYVRDCFKQYGLVTDGTGRYTAMYKPYHLIGLELGISVASAALRREPTGVATGFRADAVATAKRDLAAGEVLDGEGGYTVWGKSASRMASSSSARSRPAASSAGPMSRPRTRRASWRKRSARAARWRRRRGPSAAPPAPRNRSQPRFWPIQRRRSPAPIAPDWRAISRPPLNRISVGIAWMR